MTPTTNNFQMNSWRENLLKVRAKNDAEEKAKEERIRRAMESGDMYKNMVSDTVEVITQEITKATNDRYAYFTEDGRAIISILRVLTITCDDLNLYTGCWPLPKNSVTGKQCFGETYRFEDEKQIDKFFDEVKSQLAEDVQIEERASSPDSKIFLERIFDVRLEIKLN